MAFSGFFFVSSRLVAEPANAQDEKKEKKKKEKKKKDKKEPKEGKEKKDKEVALVSGVLRAGPTLLCRC